MARVPVFEPVRVKAPAAATPAPSRTTRPAWHAYVILRVGFIALPILAGADKVLGLFGYWDQYLAPIVTKTLPVDAHTFMLGAGVVEILAGIIVAIRPRIGAWIVALWLWGIIANLLLVPGFYDVALRDVGLSLAAVALARLSREFGGSPPPGS